MDFRVRWFPDGPEGEATSEQTLNGGSPKEAAERLHGGPLHEQGANHQLRAQVRVTIIGKTYKILFFER